MEDIITIVLNLLVQGGTAAWMLLTILVLLSTTTLAFLLYKISSTFFYKRIGINTQVLEKSDIKELLEIHTATIKNSIDKLSDRLILINDIVEKIKDLEQHLDRDMVKLSMEHSEIEDYAQKIGPLKDLIEMDMSQSRIDRREINKQIQQLRITLATLQGAIIGSIARDRESLK